MCDYDYYRNMYKNEVNLYTQEYVRHMQTQLLPYIKAPIHRIIAPDGKEKCCQCSKRASFYNVADLSMLCWKHSNELMKNQE